MNTPERDVRPAVAQAQDTLYGEEFDYDVSPHIRHRSLRAALEAKITAAVMGILATKASCRVLEVGAGHGGFTDVARRAGAEVTVTEMSEARFRFLEKRFADVPDVTVVFDPDGSAATSQGERFDVVMLISVVHHIPDYIGFVSDLCHHAIEAGGAILTFQDPLWYPRQSQWSRLSSEAAYLAWRVMQGNLQQGIGTRLRRIRGVYDESSPSDMVEYHVVRDGVDEQALFELLLKHFSAVRLHTYYSTALPIIQRAGDRLLPDNTFALSATGFFARRVEGV